MFKETQCAIWYSAHSNKWLVNTVGSLTMTQFECSDFGEAFDYWLNWSKGVRKAHG